MSWISGGWRQRATVFLVMIMNENQPTRLLIYFYPRKLSTSSPSLCRLPGPSRVPAAGSGASRGLGSSNLNRRSQSFNSIDKSKPLQYASGNDRGKNGMLIEHKAEVELGLGEGSVFIFSFSATWWHHWLKDREADRSWNSRSSLLPALTSLLNHSPAFYSIWVLMDAIKAEAVTNFHSVARDDQRGQN